MKKFSVIFWCVVAILGIALFAPTSLEYISFADLRRAVASVFFVDSITEGELKNAYAQAPAGGAKVKVLVVPGHDDAHWGTEFAGLREADATLAVGKALAAALARDSALAVTLVRDEAGYFPAFETYFQQNKEAIRALVAGKKKIMNDLMAAGSVGRADGVVHNSAAFDVALRLYALNQWANENNYQLVLHLHFNDFAGRTARTVGTYDGFALYVPDTQYSNAKASAAVAELLVADFSRFFASSNLSKENSGVVPDQDLIAVGAYNTLDAASILIEYAYIYETGLRDGETRAALFSEYAEQTFAGVERFFAGAGSVGALHMSLLPHDFEQPIGSGTRGSEVLALQAALIAENAYPPAGKNLHACPLSGKFGPCTEASVAAFQKKYGLAPSGFVGLDTRTQLNLLYTATP